MSLTFSVHVRPGGRRDAVVFDGKVRFIHNAGKRMLDLERELPDWTAADIAKLPTRATALDCDRLEGEFLAEKAAEAGVDGIVAVAAGAGGHAGTLSPFALVSEIRGIFGGAIALAGAINTGAQIAAARMMGADLAYMGTRFIATQESLALPEQKRMILDAAAADILYTPRISGVNANFLRPSLVAAGLDPDNLPDHGKIDMEGEAKAWRDVWSAGQGVGGITDLPDVATLATRLAAEYRAALDAAVAGARAFA